MSKKKAVLCCVFAMALISFTRNAYADLYWADEVSEEHNGPPSWCDFDDGVVGFSCRGHYCDNLRVLCETMPFDIDLYYYSWSEFYSEESSIYASWTSAGWYRYDRDNYHVCHRTNTGGIVTGIRCRGSNCDDISVECTVPYRHGEPIDLIDCEWSEWLSEEDGGWIDFGWNRYITGIECSGSYCDNKRFYVCSASY